MSHASRLRPTIRKIGLVCVGLLIGLICSELLARLVLGSTLTAYYIWPPGNRTVFSPQSGLMPGVEGEALFQVNAVGLRGDEYDPDPAIHHILTIGGSTTECLYLDQPRTWPELLADRLAERGGDQVWVGNAGVSGDKSWHHVIALRYLLQQLPDVDTVIVLIGINDMGQAVGLAGQPLPEYDLVGDEPPPDLMRETFYRWPDPAGNALVLPLLIGDLQTSFGLNNNTRQTLSGSQYIGWRQSRQSASEYRDELPNLSHPLDVYESYLLQIIALASQHGVQLVFVTQPAVWRDDLSSQFEAMLWWGRIGSFDDPDPVPYYSTDALQRTMRLYNARLLEVCAEQDVLCVDAAQAMNGSTTYFYDDVHFNYSGAEALANIIADALTSARSVP